MVNLLKFIVFVISFFTYFSSIVYATSVTVTGYVEREREAGMFFYYLNSQTNGKIFLGSENEFTDDTNKQCIMDSFKNDKVITLEGILQKDGDDKSFVDSKFSCTNVNDQKYIKVNDQKNENLPKIKLFDINFDMNYNDVIENGLKKGYIVAATDIIPKYKSELKKLDELIALNLPRILPYTNMNDKILQEVKEFNSNPDLYNKNNELGFDGICYHKA